MEITALQRCIASSNRATTLLLSCDCLRCNKGKQRRVIKTKALKNKITEKMLKVQSLL